MNQSDTQIPQEKETEGQATYFIRQPNTGQTWPQVNTARVAYESFEDMLHEYYLQGIECGWADPNQPLELAGNNQEQPGFVLYRRKIGWQPGNYLELVSSLPRSALCQVCDNPHRHRYIAVYSPAWPDHVDYPPHYYFCGERCYNWWIGGFEWEAFNWPLCGPVIAPGQPGPEKD